MWQKSNAQLLNIINIKTILRSRDKITKNFRVKADLLKELVPKQEPDKNIKDVTVECIIQQHNFKVTTQENSTTL